MNKRQFSTLYRLAVTGLVLSSFYSVIIVGIGIKVIGIGNKLMEYTKPK